MVDLDANVWVSTANRNNERQNAPTAPRSGRTLISSAARSTSSFRIRSSAGPVTEARTDRFPTYESNQLWSEPLRRRRGVFTEAEFCAAVLAREDRLGERERPELEGCTAIEAGGHAEAKMCAGGDGAVQETPPPRSPTWLGLDRLVSAPLRVDPRPSTMAARLAELPVELCSS